MHFPPLAKTKLPNSPLAGHCQKGLRRPAATPPKGISSAVSSVAGGGPMGGGEAIAASSEISTILEVQSSERFHLATWWPCVETLPGCKLCAKMAGYLDIQCDPSKEDL